MERQLLRVDSVPSNDRQLSWQAYETQGVGDTEGAIVEKNMMVLAEAQKIVEIIGTVERPPERPTLTNQRSDNRAGA